MYNISYKYKSAIIFFIKLFIVGAAFYYISFKSAENNVLFKSTFIHYFNENIIVNSYFIVLIFLCTLLNWSLEIIKWKTLISSFKSISFFEAGKQSLSSLTASLLTPNRIGEYGAKAIYYNKPSRYKVMFLNFLGNSSQMLTTILFGLFGLGVLRSKIIIPIHINILTILFLGFLFCVILLYIVKKYWLKYALKLKYYFILIPIKIHTRTLLYAALRYLIFSHQFYFLLLFFGVSLNYFTAMPIIYVMYFVASIIPGFVIFDWIIKGSVAVAIFQIFGVDDIVILSITSLMWLLNFALPAIFGSYFVLVFKHEKLYFVENSIKS